MKQSVLFSIKIWLTTILLSPLLRLLMQGVFKLKISGFNLDPLGYFKAAAYVGFFYSLPGAVVLWISVLLLNNTGLSNTIEKLIASTIALITTLLTFYLAFWLTGTNTLSVNFYMTLPYLIFGIGSVWFYRLKPKVSVPY